MQISEIILYVILFIILVVVGLVIAKLYNGGKESFAVGGGRRLKKLRKIKKRKRYHGGAAFAKTVGANAVVNTAVQPIIANVVNYDAAGHKNTGDELVAYANQLKLFSDVWVPIDDDPTNGGTAGTIFTADGVIDKNVGDILTAITALDILNGQAAISQLESTDYDTKVQEIINASTDIKAQTLIIKKYIDNLVANESLFPPDVANQTELADILIAVNGGISAQNKRDIAASILRSKDLAADYNAKLQVFQALNAKIPQTSITKYKTNKKQAIISATTLSNSDLNAYNAVDPAIQKNTDDLTQATKDVQALKDIDARDPTITYTTIIKPIIDKLYTQTDAKKIDTNFTKLSNTDKNKFVTDLIKSGSDLNQKLAKKIKDLSKYIAKLEQDKITAKTKSDKSQQVLADLTQLNTTENELAVIGAKEKAEDAKLITLKAAPGAITAATLSQQCKDTDAAADLLVANALATPIKATLGIASDAKMRYISSFIDDTANAALTTSIKATYQIFPLQKEPYTINLLGDPTKNTNADTSYDTATDSFKHSAEVINSVCDFIKQYFIIRQSVIDLYNNTKITFIVADTALNDITDLVELLLKTYYQIDAKGDLPRLVTFLAIPDKTGNKNITVFNVKRTADIDNLSTKIKSSDTTLQAAGAPSTIIPAQFNAAIDDLKANSVTPWYPDGALDYYKVISHDRLTDTVLALTGTLVTAANKFAADVYNTSFDNNNVRESIQLSLEAYQELKTSRPISNNLSNITTDRMEAYVMILMYIDYIGRFLDYLLSLYDGADVHMTAKVQQIDVIIQKLFRQTNLQSGDTTGQDAFQKELFGRDNNGKLKAPNPAGLEFNPALEYATLKMFVNAMVNRVDPDKSFAFKLYNIAYSFRLILPPSLEALPMVIDPGVLTLTTSRVPVNSAKSINKLDAIMTAITKAYALWRYGIAAVECGARTNDTLLTQTDLLLTDSANGLLDNYNKFKQALANGSIANSDTFKDLKDKLFESFKQFRWKLMSKRNFTPDEDGPNTNDEKQIYGNMKLADKGGKIPYNPYYDKLQQYLTVVNGSTDVTTLINAFTTVAEPYNGVLNNAGQFNYLLSNDPVTNKPQRAGVLTVTWPNDKSATFQRIYELLVYNGSKLDTEPISQDHPPSLMALFIQTLNSPELNIPQQINKQRDIQATSFGPGAIGSTKPLVEPPPATVETPQFKTYKVAPNDPVSFTSLSEGSILTVGDLKQTTGNVVVVADSVDDLNKKIQRIVDEKSGARNLYGLVVDMTGETTLLFKSVAIELGMKPPADIEKLLGDKRKSSRGWLYEIKQYPNGEFYLSIIAYIKPVEYQV